MDQLPKLDSAYPVTPQRTSYKGTSPHNPYQRMASRRAIACVTCAKAKTKCDKGLPSCSRCITKGIKCDPRSTRRTSENSYRTNVKKPFVSSKRYHSTSNISTPSRHSSARSIPSSNRHRAMRVASHIDFRTAVKMSQQASACSGYPMLTPLPTYTSQIDDECCPYPSSPDQSLASFPSVIELSSLPVSGRLTPQTPEPIVYSEPLSMEELSDPLMASQPWTDEYLMSVGFGFNGDITAQFPAEIWSTPEHAHIAPIAQMSWHQQSVSVSPQIISGDIVPHARAVPALSISECSIDDFYNPGTFHEDWAICQPTTAQPDIANIVTSAPFIHDPRSISGTAPVWEDVFMPGQASY